MMGPPPGMFPGDQKKQSIPKPQSLKEVPSYLKTLLSGFFGRLFYIFSIVWKTAPWILISMSLIALLQGLLPIASLHVSSAILNALQSAYSLALTGAEPNDFLRILPWEAIVGIVRGSDDIVFWASLVFSFVLLFFMLRIVSSMISLINNAVTRIGGELVVRQVKVMIMEKAKELDLASFDLPEFYEKLENANREAGHRPIQILSSTFLVITHAIQLASYIITLVMIPKMWIAALTIVLLAIPTAIVNFTFRRKNFDYIRRRSKDRRQMNYYSDLMVNKDLVKEVRMFHLSDTFIDRYQTTFDKYFAGLRRLIWRENIGYLIINVATNAAYLVFFALIAYYVFIGNMMIGDYSLYTNSLMSVSSCISALISVSATIYEGTLFIDNLIAFIKEKQTVVPVLPEPTEECPHPTPAKVHHGSAHTIVFDHVSFCYPGSDRRVLDDVCVTIRPGETLVLVGLNGAGKTTLIKLLTRLYDPTEGKILLDGKDLREYDVEDLYKMFGIIFQDFGKYAVSVSENIAFGDVYQKADLQKIRQAAIQSNADEYISKLSGGYDTALMRYFEPDGIELSIGQWQKLAIARAFYSESDILILDEPTASLDPMAEQEIFNQFDRLRADKTTIFVSHRLSSATVATKILVMEYGRVIEEGDHRTLMDKKGRYHELFSTQAKRYISEQDAVGRPPEPPHGHKPPPFAPPKHD
ncbi:MAG: ABC transporter ATP-binding protein [Clostridia bacterium]|nr:ABC transporter ATP-binding protein [Clostridia bacterium]